MYLNDATRLNFNIGIDTDETTSIILKYRDPDGDESSFDSVSIETAVDGDCYVDIDNDIINLEGVWTFWSYIVVSGNEFSGNPFYVLVKPSGVNITTRDFVKTWLSISVTTYDTVIDALIRTCEQDYLNIRNVPWDTDDEDNIVYPIGSDTVIANMVGYKLENRNNSEYKDITSEKIGDYAVGFSVSNTLSGYPKSITGSIKTYIDGT